MNNRPRLTLEQLGELQRQLLEHSNEVLAKLLETTVKKMPQATFAELPPAIREIRALSRDLQMDLERTDPEFGRPATGANDPLGLPSPYISNEAVAQFFEDGTDPFEGGTHYGGS